MPRSKTLTILLLCALSIAPACGSHGAVSETDDAKPIAECEAFVSALEHCVSNLGPPEVARARAARTRAAFDATHGAAARAALRQKCTDNLAQIKTTCP